ncbi:MAG: zf-HC2 domain-containing protein [Clostridia bacterium]|nr:zf-HC2 domain-containing protein [Clostridia bacterium]
MKNNCKLVQDLLPNYIEKITAQETNEFVENHLKTCEICRDIHLNMISDLEKENVKNTEVVKTIKKYKRKIFLIKFIIFSLIIGFLISTTANIVFKYWVVSKAFEKNTNFDLGGNYTIAEYDESIEKNKYHIETYFCDGKMKKVYGDDVLEYYDGKDHYYIDNENKTYYIEKDVELNSNLNINISLLEGTENIVKNGKVDKFEVLKFVLFQDEVFIWEEGFRNCNYYIIKNITDTRVYLDKETFIAQRTEICNKNEKEYRVTISNVNYRMVSKPDLSNYKLVEK